MNILITGACGFIGRNLIEDLEQHGHDLVLVDRQKPEEATVFVPGASSRALSPLKTSWPFHQIDVMNVEVLRKVCRNVDAIVHLAGIPTGLPNFGIETFSFNAVGTYHMLDICRTEEIGRFVAASSINAYGTFYWRLNRAPIVYTHLPLTERFPPEPQDPYSLSKLVNEETCAAFNRAYGIKTAALRFGAVWTHEMYSRARAEGLSPTLSWSDDLYTWVHVEDIATGIRQAIEAADLPGFGAYTLNASDTTRPEPTMELLRKFRPDYLSILTEPIEGRGSLISVNKAAEAFGFAPKYRLDT